MLAGVLDRYREMRRLLQKPVAISAGTRNSLSASGAGLALTVSPMFLFRTEQEQARIVLDRVIELLGTAQISAAMRWRYGDFAESVRNSKL
jgi:hypothetical protein